MRLTVRYAVILGSVFGGRVRLGAALQTNRARGGAFRSPRAVTPIGPNHQLVTTISN